MEGDGKEGADLHECSELESKNITEAKREAPVSELQCEEVTEAELEAHGCSELESKVINETQIQAPVDIEDGDSMCGIGCFKPKWLQTFATIRSFAVLFIIVGVLQGANFTYFNAIISTLEKRFTFSTKVGAFMLMIDELMPLFLNVFVGYFGAKAHRPRTVAIGMFLSTLCCLISAMPFFIYGPAKHGVLNSVTNETGVDLCDSQSKEEKCDEDSRPPTLTAVVLLFIGSFLNGFGTLAYYIVGIPYMDDIAKKKHSPLYFALVSSLRTIGPIMGYLICYEVLRYPEDLSDDPGYALEDPRWIGAWWLGFVIQGLLVLIFAFPLMLFPRYLPGHKRPSLTTREQEKKKTFKEIFVDFGKALKRIVKNKVFMCLSFGCMLNAIGVDGYNSLLPKYIENQFRISASDASLFSGPPKLIFMTACSLLGGFAIWKFKPSARLIMGLFIFADILRVAGYLFLMIPSCQNLSISGSTVTSNGLALENECNRDCFCTTKVFNPICGPDGQSTYFSPCHAGCKEWNDSPNVESANYCSCILNSTTEHVDAVAMKTGFCEENNCWSQAVVFIVLIPLLNGIVIILKMSYPFMLFRSVEPEDKGIAIGFSDALLCLALTVPCPLVYGALVDSACLVWESSCGETGNCWIYDNNKLRFLMHGVTAVFPFLNVVFDIAVFFMSDKFKSLYDEPDVIFREDCTYIGNEKESGR